MKNNKKADDTVKQISKYQDIILRMASESKDKYRPLYEELADRIAKVGVAVTIHYLADGSQETYDMVKDMVWDLWLDIKARSVEGFLSASLAEELKTYFWSLLC